MNSPDTLDPRDAAAWRAVTAVRPVLAGLLPAREAFAYPQRTLLHAGPPLPGDGEIPWPMLNSIVNAALYEGWAVDRADALYGVRTGAIRLAPAQDHRCVVPLAAILSPSQHVQVVRDAAGRAAPCHAALNGGNRWPIRLGRPETEVAEHLRWLNGPFAEQLRAGCEAGIDLVELADQALAAGDDCHGRTLAGTQALAASLRALGHAPEDGAVADYLAQSPGFFLNLWMAASKCMLSAAEGMAGSSLVTAMGGNGREAGIQLAALPGRWFSRRCGAPRGALEPGLSGAQPLPAIGDSAVVEALGLGAMAMAHSPAQQQALGAYMPEPAAALGAALLGLAHPAFERSHPRMGLAARAVAATGKAPVVALGMLDSLGTAGRIGGGIWTADPGLFAHALEFMAQHQQGESR